MSSDDDSNKRWCDFVYKYDNKIRYFEVKHFRNDAKLEARLRQLLEERVAIAIEKADPLTPYSIMQLAKDEEERDASLLAGKDLTGQNFSLKPPAIERPPGHRIIVLLQMVLPRSTFERVYGQMIADSRAEYFEALDQGDNVEANKIKRQLYFNIAVSVAAFLAGLPFHLLEKPLGKIFNKDE